MEFSSKETWLHRINPSIKLFVLISLCIAVLFIDHLHLLIHISLVVFILFFGFTGQSFKRILLFTLPFLLIFFSTSSSLILFGKGETVLYKWGLIIISEESIYKGLTVGCRGIIFAGLGLTFALTTRPVFLFYSLMQQLKMPPKYAYSFMASLRLIPIMIEEFQTIQYAMRVRGVEHQNGIQSIFLKVRAYSIPLLSQSIRRAHRIAVAMEAKRFSNQKTRTFYYELTFSKYDLLFILYFVIMISFGFYISMRFFSI
ncbi:energy-coupling factor transporter transmembrane protein EcfT [Bacillus timonensis]|uniref:Energy-coupling factor transporter transmembrane protein EcfT n=1 Tax=Bacillus timonensis TaxID=1033734 RepID=A0A4S3PN48_9BACI|nr:energy-coupling factor transporter transmembrane component T [Bacillus timonensis]THE10868.1 energy-coupling factor transporter transmembrane protein EcfT [Bacillus timonensis]